jgi:alpha-methylacyl-CoA racemase
LRVSGYGQTGENRLRPGHDANYLAVGGILSLLNKKGEHQFPMNYMADFVSASLGISGVLAALRDR